MRISITIPTVHAPQLLSNLLGVAGLIGLAVAIGALTGNWWWSVLSGSLISIGLAWVANTHAREAAPAGNGEQTETLYLAPSRSA